MNKNLFGNEGEKLAREYLLSKGLTFIVSNYRYSRKEIDLIFADKKHKILIFIEVKTRHNKSFGEPEESITFKKQKNIKEAALGYISVYGEFKDYDLRFDSVSILITKNQTIINHIENAF